MKRLRRSTVLIPGNVPEFLDKSRAVEADVLLFDVQDAIARDDAAKREARDRVVAALRGGGFRARELSVRVNNPGSPWIADDIAAVVAAGAHSITVSRSFSAADVAFAEGCLRAAASERRVEIILEVDTPALLAELETVARSATRVTGVSIASGDFALEMGVPWFGPERSGSEAWLSYARSKLVTIARWQGWNACDLISADPKDPEAIKTAMRASRALGFDGVALVFPRQAAIANEVFGVTAAELAWAQRIVAGWKEQDDGPNRNKSFRIVDGEMVFAPVHEYARRVLSFHAVIAGDAEAVRQFRAHGLASPEYLAEQQDWARPALHHRDTRIRFRRKPSCPSRFARWALRWVRRSPASISPSPCPMPTLPRSAPPICSTA